MKTYLRIAAALVGAALLASCQRSSSPQDAHSAPGQVKPAASASVTRYAAARFADQATFGATPELVAEIQAKGFSAWIDAEFAKPVSQLDLTPIQQYDSQISEQSKIGYKYARNQLMISLMTAPDQLRRRVAWSLSQFITTAINKIEPYGGMAYSNFLQQNAFENFGTLLRRVTLNPSMGVYLDNYQNRPTTTECSWCAPNENYSREMLQLFTLGTVLLNQDGSVKRDAAGKPIETYSQKDVEELARALTGWKMAKDTERTDYRRYDGEMVMDSWSVAHDRGAKTVLGSAIPANLDASGDLDRVVAIVMAHPNLAPFISVRLIQHLVTSDPSPAYIARISAVFNNNGSGVKGDLKAVVKAILLDPEARKGDVIGADTAGFGKMREPVLWYTGLLRGMSCTQPLQWDDDSWGPLAPASQNPFDPTSVFSYYAPTDRAPGSNLLAPEQKLLTAEEYSFRFGIRGELFERAGNGCNLAPFGQALLASPSAFADLVGERYFRSAMPATLRQNLISLAPEVYGNTPNERAASLLIFALSSPYYGVMK
jgi:uncharacterized protein (DUF1800 family)